MRDALRCAAILADVRNFHAAARQVGVSQSQFSRIIQSLEKQLGVKLFDRDRQGVRVSADGETVLRDAAAVLKAEDILLARVAAIRNRKSAEVRVAVGAFVSQAWLSEVMADLAEDHPEIALSIRELDWWNLATAAISGEYDLAIGELSDAELGTEIVIDRFPERMGSIFVRAGHTLAGRHHVTLEQVADFPLAAPRLPNRVFRFLPEGSKLGRLSEDGRFFMPMIECATPQSTIQVVSRSNAVCMLLPQLCKEELRTGTLVELPLHPPWLHVRQGIMHMRGRTQSAATQTFRTAAKAAERKYFVG